jgi:hypothetical protein
METKFRNKAMVLVVGILCAVSILCATASADDILNGSCIGPQGLTLVNQPTVQDGSSFIAYIVVSPETDGQLLMKVKLPNGFHMETDPPASISLKAYEPQIIPLKIDVKKFVAEQDHLIQVELTDNGGNQVSTAETAIKVWWDWTTLAA